VQNGRFVVGHDGVRHGGFGDLKVEPACAGVSVHGEERVPLVHHAFVPAEPEPPVEQEDPPEPERSLHSGDEERGAAGGRITNNIICDTIKYLLRGGRLSSMTAPTQLVSLRLSEDDIARLEERVGLDGTRSRSDVIRLAIQRLLSDAPTDPDMDRITIDIGLSVKQDLRAMRTFTGMAPEAVAQMALQQHIADFVAATKARRTEMGDLYEELSAQEHSSKEHQ